MMEWFAMGGYGKFVWSAYSISFFVILINYLIPRWQEKRFKRELTKRLQPKQSQ